MMDEDGWGRPNQTAPARPWPAWLCVLAFVAASLLIYMGYSHETVDDHARLRWSVGSAAEPMPASQMRLLRAVREQASTMSDEWAKELVQASVAAGVSDLTQLSFVRHVDETWKVYLRKLRQSVPPTHYRQFKFVENVLDSVVASTYPRKTPSSADRSGNSKNLENRGTTEVSLDCGTEGHVVVFAAVYGSGNVLCPLVDITSTVYKACHGRSKCTVHTSSLELKHTDCGQLRVLSSCFGSAEWMRWHGVLADTHVARHDPPAVPTPTATSSQVSKAASCPPASSSEDGTEKCTSTEFEHMGVIENKELVIDCSTVTLPESCGKPVVEVVHAGYGYPENKLKHCFMADVRKFAVSACNGQTKCTLQVSGRSLGVEGDPCSGMVKHLDFKYECVGKKVLKLVDAKVAAKETKPEAPAGCICPKCPLIGDVTSNADTANVPMVSVLTLTDGDRRAFSHNIWRNFARSAYPATHRELVVLDQAKTPSAFFTELARNHSNVKYHHLDTSKRTALRMGEARNFLLDHTSKDSKVILNFDSDDFYPAPYVSYMVSELIRRPAVKWLSPNAVMEALVDQSGGVRFLANMAPDLSMGCTNVFRKEVAEHCVYGGVVTEEHLLYSCIRDRWGEQARMQLPAPAHTDSLFIKFDWAGTTVRKHFPDKKDPLTAEAQDAHLMKGAHARVVRVLHALDMLSWQPHSYQNPSLTELLLQLGFWKAPKCKQWSDEYQKFGKPRPPSKPEFVE